ncbi:MAG: TRAP transporter small permease [Chloroflexota bacterium]
MIEKVARNLENWARWVSRKINTISLIMLVLMMLLTVADVVMRYGFNSPFIFSYDVTQFMMSVMVFFGLAYCSMEGGQVAVDLLGKALPPRTLSWIDIFTNLVSLVLFTLISWQCFLQAAHIRKAGETGGVIPVPVYPFIYLVAIGSVVLSFVLLSKMITAMAEVARK